MFEKLKKYTQINYLILALVLVGCNLGDDKPNMMIELEIEESINSVDQKNKYLAQIQKRLEANGATNVSIKEESDQKITVVFGGKIQPEKIQHNFTRSGKLEFFEVATSTMEILNYFMETYTVQDENGDLLPKNTIADANNDFIELINRIQLLHNNANDGIIGYVAPKDKDFIKASAIYQKSHYIKSIKKRVKFLLGKGYKKKDLCLRFVVVSSKDEAPLDGSHITETSTREGYIQGNHVISIQMDEAGAKIWEQLTEQAYQHRFPIAITIDDFIYSAPMVTTGGIAGGNTEISGGFSKEEAIELAQVIKAGTIPKVKILSVTTLKETIP